MNVRGLRLCSAERTTRPERTPLGHVRGQCTLTLTDENVAFPEFCGQSNLNSARMFMQMFVIRFYCGIRSRSASRQAHSRRILAVLQCTNTTPSLTATSKSSRNISNTTCFAHARASVRFC